MRVLLLLMMSMSGRMKMRLMLRGRHLWPRERDRMPLLLDLSQLLLMLRVPVAVHDPSRRGYHVRLPL